MKHVTHGETYAQVTEKHLFNETDVRTEHLQRSLTRIIDRFLAEEGIANKGPGSKISVKRAFESSALLIEVDVLAGYCAPEKPSEDYRGRINA